MILKTLMKSIREYKKDSILSAVLVAMEVLCECSITLVMSFLVNEVQGFSDASPSYTMFFVYGGALIALSFISLFFGMTSARKAAKASCGFAKNLRKDLYYAIQDFSFKDVDKFSASSLVTRLTTDVMNVQMAYGMIIRIAVRAPLMIIISIAFSFTKSVRLALIMLAVLPFLAFAVGFIAFKAGPLFRRIFKKYDALNESVQENVSGIRVVKSYVREDYEIKKFKNASGEVCKDFTKAEKLLAWNNPIMTFAIYLMILLVSAVGTYFIVSSYEATGEPVMKAGDLTALIAYGVQMLSSLMMVTMIMVMVSMSVESSRRIVEVLQTAPDLVNKENPVMEVKDGSISFKDVSFKYSETADKYALSDINIDIAAGETIGIIGGTGSSKSTLIQLIPRLYDVTEGSITVGGVDVKDYDIKTLRDSVSVVLQKNILFSGTVRENMQWGDKNATDEEINRALDIAQASSFINGDLDKHIEQGGANVSGGQKQRLCIARAILKKPKIIIFDDSTSAVDTKTDAMIRKGLSTEIPDTTKIIIAQRVSSVQDADRIIVMDGGKICGIGTHEELLKSNSIYREVYDLQTSNKNSQKEAE